MPINTETQTLPVPLYTNPKKGSLRLRGNHVEPSAEAYPELDTKGYTVVKNVISAEKAAGYVDRMYNWLEGFGNGFKKDDRSTWRVDKLPYFSKGGLYNRHCAGQEQVAWDIRSEPALIEVFAKIWNTEELLCSVDGMNISLPLPAEDLEGDRGSAWPHVDQSPNRRFKHCVQGIMNLAENGPNDGGLMVLEGSLPLYNEYFETHEKEFMPKEGWTWRDSYHFAAEGQLQWFYDRGCTWKKVEAGPGDVILWDSRCIHYGAAARGDQPRVATYVCYKPAADIEPEMLELRKKMMAEGHLTSHDPLLFRLTGSKIFPKERDDERTEVTKPAVLSDRALQLAGVKAY